MRIVISLLLLMVLTGCGGGGSDVASDCGLALRFEGVVYPEAGFAESASKRVGEADFASCDDTGDDPQGAYFPDQPRQVEVWSFRGQDTDTVLGTREPNGEFRVFVAEGKDAIELLRAISRAQGRQRQ